MKGAQIVNVPEKSSYPLEPDAEEMRELGNLILEFIITHIQSLPLQDSHGLEASCGVCDSLEKEGNFPPHEGTPIGEILRVFSEALPQSLNTAAPGYFAYIPGGGLYAAALADFMACATNRYVGIRGAAPALAQIELNVIRWFCRWMGYGSDAMGILTSGGSLANFSAFVTARTALLPENFLKGTFYCSSQAHHSVSKAAHLAGFPRSNMRIVQTDAGLRMDLTHLSRLVSSDRMAGNTPFMVVANGGTTNTGAIDPLEGITDLARAQNLWLHVDAAYGGFFNITSRGEKALAGIDGADSITLDPHKGLFLPYGTGCLLVRRGDLLRNAHRGEAEYLKDLDGRESFNFSDYSPELSRDFRGLRAWLPLTLHGSQAFIDALDEKLDLARYAYERLSMSGLFEMEHPPELSLLAFRGLPHKGDPDEFNRMLLSRVNSEKRVFLSSTLLDNKVTLRLCMLNFRSHHDRVAEAVESLIAHAGQLRET